MGCYWYYYYEVLHMHLSLFSFFSRMSITILTESTEELAPKQQRQQHRILHGRRIRAGRYLLGRHRPPPREHCLVAGLDPARKNLARGRHLEQLSHIPVRLRLHPRPWEGKPGPPGPCALPGMSLGIPADAQLRGSRGHRE